MSSQDRESAGDHAFTSGSKSSETTDETKPQRRSQRREGRRSPGSRREKITIVDRDVTDPSNGNQLQSPRHPVISVPLKKQEVTPGQTPSVPERDAPVQPDTLPTATLFKGRGFIPPDKVGQEIPLEEFPPAGVMTHTSTDGVSQRSSDSSQPETPKETRVFNRRTLIAVLSLFQVLGGCMITIAFHKQRGSSCAPNKETIHKDDGFWVLLSQLFILLPSTYCTLYIAHADEKSKEWLEYPWLLICLAVSVSAAISAVVVYGWNWQWAIVLSFVSGSVQVISLGQAANVAKVTSRHEHSA